MWMLHNRTRFKAARTFLRDRDGAEVWIVAVRATYNYEVSGRVALAETQQDVRLGPEYFGDPALSSLRYETDVVRTKSGTDILIHACAHAPNGRPESHIDVSCTIGEWTKRLRVYGNRVWKRRGGGLAPSAPEPVLSCPIRYERAWGGALPRSSERDPFNPVGVGRDAVPGAAVPNCELLDARVSSPDHRGPPAGLGPLAGHWQPRAGLAGTYDHAWMQERRPLVPRDFSDNYFRCAPADQQLGAFLRGGEDVVLQNLTPGQQIAGFRLPRVQLGCSTLIGGSEVYHPFALHTVILEPEERRLIMVWQSALPCHFTLYALQRTTVYEKRQVGAELDRTSGAP